MKNPYTYYISRIGLEPLARNICSKIFSIKLFLSTKDEDMELKTDIKNTNNLLTNENINQYLTFQVKTKSSYKHHYALSWFIELDNNNYCIFYKAPFEENYIKLNNMLYDFDFFANYLKKNIDNKKIYIVKSDYLKILKNHKNSYFRFYDADNQWRVTNNDFIEKAKVLFNISDDYVKEYILTDDDINNLREEFLELQKEINLNDFIGR